MDTNTKMGISWTGTLQAIPIGYQHVVLKSRNEHYLIGRPVTTVNNLILGNMYIEHVGIMTVKNCNTGMICPIEFKAVGMWSSSDKHQVRGKVMANDKSSAVLATIQGSWSESLTYSLASNLKTELPLWQSNPMPEKHDWQYYFTNFTMKLNNLPEKMRKKLPRSDSRLRPDQRALENFDIELATSEKHRLEEKQRAARKYRAENPGNDF